MPIRHAIAPTLVAFLLGLALGVAPGCDSPTLPLPPPTALVSAPDAGGFVTVEVHGAEPGAFVMVLNVARGIGVIDTADSLGSAALRIEATAGQRLQVWQRVGTETSELNEILVPGSGDAGP